MLQNALGLERSKFIDTKNILTLEINLIKNESVSKFSYSRGPQIQDITAYEAWLLKNATIKKKAYCLVEVGHTSDMSDFECCLL